MSRLTPGQRNRLQIGAARMGVSSSLGLAVSSFTAGPLFPGAGGPLAPRPSGVIKAAVMAAAATHGYDGSFANIYRDLEQRCRFVVGRC